MAQEACLSTDGDLMDAVHATLCDTTGVWAPQLRSRDRGKIRDVATILENLGFGALWVPGAAGGPLLDDMGVALAATSRVVLASGVLNIWMHNARDTAGWLDKVQQTAPERTLLGVGVSHPHRTVAIGKAYRPMEAMRDYLDQLDGANPPVPPSKRVLAALGPRMLDLAKARTAGAHTYLVDATHTAAARAALGPGRLLTPEVKVVLDTNRARAVDTARRHLGDYLKLGNYTRNLMRSGYRPEDLAGGGSERLIDGLFAIGDVDAARHRVDEHRVAGADHVCVQVITTERGAVPWNEWHRLADGLLSR